MLKEFCIDYVDANGCRRTEQVVAFDASQAMHVLEHMHPEASVMGLGYGVPLRTVLASRGWPRCCSAKNQKGVVMDVLAEIAPKALGILVFLDLMLFLCGQASVVGWICDKLGI